MKALTQGPSVVVKAIEIVGNRVIATPVLLALVSGDIGKSLTLAQLQQLAERITLYYRQHGYFVARAYIPAQEVTQDTIKIRVVEGGYGVFHLSNTSLVRDSVVQGMLDDIKSDNIVSTDTLERAMLIINDTPGVKVTQADVAPGTQVGTSDFTVRTEATPRVDGYIAVDNYGSTYTGKNRLSFDVNINSPLGLGDQLSLSGLASNNGNLLDGRIDYSIPLASNGLRGDVALSKTHYELGDSYAHLEAMGFAKTASMGLTYPLRRTELQTINASVTASYSDLYDSYGQSDQVTPKTSTSLTAGLSLRDDSPLFGLGGETQASLNAEIGELRFKNQAAFEADAAAGGADSNGGYSKLVLALSRSLTLPYRFTLTAAMSLQHVLNNKDLDGSERMAVSGWNAVMAYPPDGLLGDNALLLHAQLSRPLPTLGSLQSSWSLFSDYGQASDVNAADGTGLRHLSDVGLGFTAQYKSTTLTANLAHRLGGGLPESESYARNKLLVQASWAF